MSVVTLNSYDLYFYAPLAQAALRGKEQLLERPLKAAVGEQWKANLGDYTSEYRQAVDKLLREEAETTEARQSVDRVMARVQTWRRLVESVARQAPPERRRTLLQASGYGLGSPRSAKQMADFLIDVKNRIDLHGPELAALGLREEALKVPTEALEEIERGLHEIARETAEDGQARDRVAAARARLEGLLRSVELAVSAATADAALFGEEKDRQAVNDIEIALSRALAESRIESRAKAQQQAVPASLLEEPVVTMDPSEA